MNLRPHHLLCIQKYTGHGYSAEFTAHMDSIVSLFAEHPETLITMVQGCDDLCQMCPNRCDGVCTALEKVEHMDHGVRTVCSLTDGDTISWDEAADRARVRIFNTDQFQTICADCQWFDLCRETEVYNAADKRKISDL